MNTKFFETEQIRLRGDFCGVWSDGNGGLTVGIYRDSFKRRNYQFPVRHVTCLAGGKFAFSIGHGDSLREAFLICRRKGGAK